jgi:hypothetical protein
MEILHITFIARSRNCQVLIQFPYHGINVLHNFMFNFSDANVTTDFSKILTDKNLLNLCNSEMENKKVIIDTPID